MKKISLSRLLSELQRRRVYRVAAAYLVTIFAVLEAADLVLPAFSAPPWIYQALVFLALALLPVVLVLAWVYDITPEGVRRDGSDTELEEDLDLGWAGRPLVFGTLLIGLVGVGAWFAGRRSAALPEPGNSVTVAVLPFISAVADSSLHQMGRDLVITLSSSLQATGNLPMAEPLAILAMMDVDGEAPSLTGSREVAARLGAANLLRGSLLRTGDGLRLEMTLYETRQLRTLGNETVTAGDIASLTDSATFAVLRMVWEDAPTAPPNPDALATRSPEALQAYLAGERAMAEGRWREAPEAFSRAIAADSTFWFAYWRLQYALNYHGSPVDSLVRARVWENRGSLPAPDRMLIEARAAPSDERIDMLREATTRFPTYWPAWWDLSEALVHHGGLFGHTLDDSRAALERTLELNPQFITAWNHLFWMATRSRGAPTMRQIIHELASGRFDEVSLQEAGINTLAFNRAQLRLVEGGEEVPAEVVQMGVSELAGYRGPIEPGEMSSSLAQVGFFDAQIQVARGILESGAADDGMQRAQYPILAHALAGGGIWDSALVAADQAARVGSGPTDLLLPYQIAVVGAWAGSLDAEAAHARRPSGASLTADPDVQAEVLWLDGILALTLGDAQGMARAAGALPAEVPDAPQLLRSLEILQGGLEGDRGAAARALRDLEREMARDAHHFRFGTSHPFLNGVHRITAARWFLQAGDTLSARELLPWYEVVLPGELHRVSMANQVLGTPALRMRADLAAAAGREREAAELQEQHRLRVLSLEGRRGSAHDP